MKKGWVIGCGVVGVLVLLCGGGLAGIIFFVLNTIQQFGKPADEFLAKVGSGNVSSAYQSAASGLKSEQTLEQFTESVKKMRLDQFQASSWNKFDMKNNQATLEGTITLTDGTVLPTTVHLVNEGTWKVLGVKPASGGVTGGDAERLTVPTEPELKKLINRDMAEFNRAIQAGDFTAFHTKLSKPFQEQKTADDLKTIFKVFVEKKIDLSAVEKVDPTVWKPATIDAEGVLLVEGEYQTRPVHIVFKLKYIRQDKDWKVIGINVETKPAE